jgi:transcriptional regulator with XRE-family HTH domain
MSGKRTAEPTSGLRFASHPALRKHLGRRLAELRDARQLTQPELADVVKISERQVQTLEAGTGGGSLETWHRLADALDVPLETFFHPGVAPTERAGEPRVPYKLRARSHQAATEQQLDTLLSEARQLDAKSVDALIHLARRRT